MVITELMGRRELIGSCGGFFGEDVNEAHPTTTRAPRGGIAFPGTCFVIKPQSELLIIIARSRSIHLQKKKKTTVKMSREKDQYKDFCSRVNILLLSTVFWIVFTPLLMRQISTR